MYLMIYKQCIYFKLVIEIIRDFYRIYFYRQSWQDSCKLWGSSSLKENNEFKLKCCISISYLHMFSKMSNPKHNKDFQHLHPTYYLLNLQWAKNLRIDECWIWDLEVSKLNLWKYLSVRKTGSSSCLLTKREDGGEDNNVNSLKCFLNKSINKITIFLT